MAAIITPSDQTDVPAGRATWPTRKLLAYSGRYRIEPPTDASMLALAYIDDRLFDANIDGGLVAWLHDEFIVEVREDQAERAAEILKRSMIDGFAETFPGAPLNGLVEPHIGLNWGEAKG